MTSEHIDTAALRAGSYLIDGMTDSCRGYDQAARFLLCDALDAARSERDDRIDPDHIIDLAGELERERARAEAAEARIAAARALIAADDGEWCDVRLVCVDAALSGGAA